MVKFEAEVELSPIHAGLTFAYPTPRQELSKQHIEFSTSFMTIPSRLIPSLTASLCCLSLSIAFAQDHPAPETGWTAAPATLMAAAPAEDVKLAFDKAIAKKDTWYFSWGYSRQQYAPSDIHISQPGQGNDFTIHQAQASDFPSSLADTFSLSDGMPNLTGPQENVRWGKFLDAEQTFAVEFALDHSKYNTNLGQTAHVTGTVNGRPVDTNMVLDEQQFNYQLHNGLNHLMINAVWLRHIYGPEKNAGDLQLIGKIGGGILLPHADTTVFGKQNQVGPKNQRICCSGGDWWQLNGWTTGVEGGFRYFATKSLYFELTAKVAYGALKGVSVYDGSADQEIWMLEEVLSAGFLF